MNLQTEDKVAYQTRQMFLLWRAEHILEHPRKIGGNSQRNIDFFISTIKGSQISQVQKNKSNRTYLNVSNMQNIDFEWLNILQKAVRR
jgi:hypothetical protein